MAIVNWTVNIMANNSVLLYFMFRIDMDHHPTNLSTKERCYETKDRLMFIIVFCTIGATLNTGGIIYLLSRDRSKCFVNLLTTMAFVDVVFLGLSAILCLAHLSGPITEE